MERLSFLHLRLALPVPLLGTSNKAKEAKRHNPDGGRSMKAKHTLILLVIVGALAEAIVASSCAPINWIAKNCMNSDCTNWAITTGVLVGCEFFNLTIIEGGSSSGMRTVWHQLYPIGTGLSFDWVRHSQFSLDTLQTELWTR